MFRVEVIETLPVNTPQSAPKMTGSMLKNPVGRGNGLKIVELPVRETVGMGGTAGARRQSLASHCRPFRSI